MRSAPLSRRTPRYLVAAALVAVITPCTARAQNASFTVRQLLSYRYPSGLVAAPMGQRIAWNLDEDGARNVWVAEGPTFAPRRVTAYHEDDGQELTGLAFSHDGNTLIYARGGDHDANFPAESGLQPDPASSPAEPKIQIWTVPFAGGSAKMLTEGDKPVVSPRGDRVAFIKNHQIWAVPLDGSKPAAQLFFARGESESPVWSPSGDRLAFVSNRHDHSFIGIYTSDSTPIAYLSPSTERDDDPQWSADGREIAYVRRPATPESLGHLDRRPLVRRGPRAVGVAAYADRIVPRAGGLAGPALGGGRPAVVSHGAGRMAPPLLDPRVGRHTAPPHPRRVHDRAHLTEPRRRVSRLQRQYGP
jgi:dipeptidyl aminopeptidase/acylaminoacyl peptidase